MRKCAKVQFCLFSKCIERSFLDPDLKDLQHLKPVKMVIKSQFVVVEVNNIWVL